MSTADTETVRYASKHVDVLESSIHYWDEGSGDPILFLHGNPTSSYLWRNVIPHVVESGRCIAPDLIGMGKSGKPDIDYGFDDSYAYLEAFIEALQLENITLVLHDWGAGLGFHYANMHRDNIKALVFMEAMYDAPNFDGMPASVRMQIKMMRIPMFSYLMGQVANVFIKKMLPSMIVRTLQPQELAMYAEPYPTTGSRKPVAVWPRAIPMDGKPADVAAKCDSWHQWLKTSDLPKLCFYVSPGIAIKKDDVTRIRSEFTNIEMVDLGEGLHFIQEDYPDEIGQKIATWMGGL